MQRRSAKVLRNEAVHVRSMFAAVKANGNHNGKKDDEHSKFQYHSLLHFCAAFVDRHCRGFMHFRFADAAQT